MTGVRSQAWKSLTRVQSGSYDCEHCASEDLVHLADEGGFLQLIILVDADRINPKVSLA
jgi:hypothetical protein